MGVSLLPTAAPMALAQADFSLNLLRATLHPATANLTASSNSFAISPISLAITLSMAYAGAHNETADEIAKVIAGGETNFTSLMQYYGGLSASMAGDGSYKLASANRLYVQHKFRLDYHYKNKLKRYGYKGHLQDIDFKAQPSETANSINAYIRDNTGGRVSDMVDAAMFTNTTRIVLLNAAYFKAPWAHKFEPAGTQKCDFYAEEDRVAQVEMMQLRGEKLYYRETDNYQALGLPYSTNQGLSSGEGKQLSMLVVLPKERDGLDSVLKGMNGATFLDLINGQRNQSNTAVDVWLPKFKLESSHTQLKETLTGLGIKRAFDGNAADFSGITHHSVLYINDVLQKAIVEVNEDGSEAAGDTVAHGEKIYKAVRVRRSEPTRFYADHPFFYAITDENAAVLFAGVYQG